MPVTLLTRAPELRRQVAVVEECRVDFHDEVAGRISQNRYYSAQPPLAHKG